MVRLNGEKFVVTGGLGFIGSHICEELVNQGKKVVCIDDCSSGSVANAEDWMDDAEIIIGDVTDMKNLKSLFKGATAVFHEACSKCTVCRKDPIRDLTVNAMGSLRVFSIAADVGAKVIHASTGSVYGDSEVIHEGGQYAPKSYYGVSKLAGEQYLRAVAEYSGLDWVSLRYFHVYGERQNSGKNGGVVPIFIKALMQNEPIHVFGDGEQTRSFTYVKDVVNANFIASNDLNHEFYNVASGLKVSLNSLIDMLKSITISDTDVLYEDARPGDIKEFNVSNVKFINDTGMKYTDFRTGIEKTINWYRKYFYAN